MNYSIYKKEVLQDCRSSKLTFKPDGRKYYVYRITDLTRTNEEHYYGSRISKKENIIEDFWEYKTSSKYNIISENRDNYKLKIIKVFDNAGDMIIYESFLHQYFNVKEHNNFWNKSNQLPWGFTTAGLKQYHSKEHILKRSITAKRTMSTIQESGLTKYQEVGLKSKITKQKKEKNGKTIAQNIAYKSWETKKKNNYVSNFKNDKRVNMIIIIDNNENIFDIIKTSFVKYCNNNKYPMNALRKSYTNRGKKIYTNLDAGNLKRLKDTYEYKKFKGFSAYKYEDLSDVLKEKLEDMLK